MAAKRETRERAGTQVGGCPAAYHRKQLHSPCDVERASTRKVGKHVGIECKEGFGLLLRGVCERRDRLQHRRQNSLPRLVFIVVDVEEGGERRTPRRKGHRHRGLIVDHKLNKLELGWSERRGAEAGDIDLQ